MKHVRRPGAGSRRTPSKHRSIPPFFFMFSLLSSSTWPTRPPRVGQTFGLTSDLPRRSFTVQRVGLSFPREIRDRAATPRSGPSSQTATTVSAILATLETQRSVAYPSLPGRIHTPATPFGARYAAWARQVSDAVRRRFSQRPAAALEYAKKGHGLTPPPVVAAQRRRRRDRSGPVPGRPGRTAPGLAADRRSARFGDRPPFYFLGRDNCRAALHHHPAAPLWRVTG